MKNFNFAFLIALLTLAFNASAETLVCTYTVPGVGNGQSQGVVQGIDKNNPAVGDQFQLVGGIGTITSIGKGVATMELAHRSGSKITVNCTVSAINPGVQGHTGVKGALEQVERIMQGQGK